MLEVHCTFLGEYHAKYQRNNKRCGFKNLRCFPHCGPNNFHHEQGFCGAPISMTVSMIASDSVKDAELFQVDRLRAWGEFALRDAPHRFPTGSVFRKSDILPLLRTDVERSNPLFESTPITEEEEADPSNNSSKQRRISFHSHKMGYHYGWVGNKHCVRLPIDSI